MENQTLNQTTKQIKYGILGYSRRAKMLKKIIDTYSHVHLICAFDDNLEYSKTIQQSEPHIPIVLNEEEFWKNGPYEFVLIASSNHLHAKHVLRAMKENVHIFCEKPIITKITDYQKIMVAKEEYEFKKQFATGFVLRHSPIFKKLKEVVGKIGSVGVVSATDVIKHTHGAHFYNNWRKSLEISGGYCVEKICHSLDILNWCIGSYPVEVFAFGGQKFWTPENKWIEESFLKKDTKFYENYQDYLDFKENNPFTCEKSICDNITATFHYKNGTNLNLMITNYAPNARRTMMFYGVEGSVEFIWEMNCATIKFIPSIGGIGTKGAKHLPCEIKTYQFGHLGMHGGGDKEIIRSWLESVEKDKPMIPDILEAFYSNNACIAVTHSLKSGRKEEVELL